MSCQETDFWNKYEEMEWNEEWNEEMEWDDNSCTCSAIDNIDEAWDEYKWYLKDIKEEQTQQMWELKKTIKEPDSCKTVKKSSKKQLYKEEQKLRKARESANHRIDW